VQTHMCAHVCLHLCVHVCLHVQHVVDRRRKGLFPDRRILQAQVRGWEEGCILMDLCVCTCSML